MYSITREGALESVGKGWGKLINRLYDAKPEDVAVAQVKEKFGGLRFYTYGESDEFRDLVDECEEESYVTCEFCGEPGKERGGGWIKTLCDKCAEE